MYNIRESLKRSVNREADNNVGGKWLTLQSIEACIISHSRVWKGNRALGKGKTSGSPPSVGLPSASPPRCVHRRTRGTISCTTPWKSRNTREQTTAATTVVYVRACMRACRITYVRAMGNFMARCPRGKCGSTWDRISHKEKSRPVSSLAASLRKWLTLCGGERLAASCCIYIYIYITHSYILKKSLGFCGE